MPTTRAPATVSGAAPSAAARAGAVLRAGGLVAFPTETVYGLGADARNADAVRRVFAAKGRPADNPLIVHVAEAGAIDAVVARVTPLATALATRWWPGPLTLVLDAAAGVPDEVTGGLSTVAVRVPAHSVAQAVLVAACVPVAAPSANSSGRPSPTTAGHVVADFGAAVDLIVDGGATRLGVESTVVDARGAVPTVLREGSITREQLGVPGAAAVGDPSHSPGTRHRHYTPRCEVVVAPAREGSAMAAQRAAHGRRVALLAATPAPAGVIELGPVADAAALARRLYAALRDGEDAACEVIVVEAVPEIGIGRAVMDRLRRAAAG